MQRLQAAGVEIGELRLVGGAAGNPLWRQILADVCEVPVRRLVEPEAAALGAALQAMWVARRQESTVAEPDIRSVSEPFVVLADTAELPGDDAARYRPLRELFVVALRRLYGVH
jgi:xylulokinase